MKARSINLQLFAQERVLPPTPRRLREARRRGEVARSTELGAALLLLAAVAAAGALFPHAAGQVAELARRFWSRPPAGDWTVADVASLTREVMAGAVVAAAPLAAVAWLVAAGVGAAQTGGLFNLSLVAPRWERLNPLAGLQRLVSRRGLVELLKAPLKLAALVAAMAPALASAGRELMGAAGGPPAALVAATGHLVQALLWRGALAYLVVAVLDYGYQRWEHERSLRMTPQEWKQDHKEAEGDPLLRQRLRQRQRQLARRRMLHEVPRADVVVTNPTHYAVALRYDPAAMAAPVVVAKGRDLLAARIRALAEEHGVPVMEEPALARALYQAADVGQEIPPELYVAVAEVLAFVWRLRGYALPAAAAPEAARPGGAGRGSVAGTGGIHRAGRGGEGAWHDR